MIFINPLLQTECFVMAVLHEVCVPTHPHIFFFFENLVIKFFDAKLI